ncbi:hypothetical protein NM688_g7731 [Phlebia brevispora]|uniref:Uncharacterized protein n=1 Tax=Phlebia brevispora TaxID=194682 RepID=A0ACC1S1R7_9APHY|nr:hypothetical protein NM688_g7731 [Phlebia brevispora]
MLVSARFKDRELAKSDLFTATVTAQLEHVAFFFYARIVGIYEGDTRRKKIVARSVSILYCYNEMAFMPKPDDNKANQTEDTAQDANPWLKIEQTVRPVDEEKVKDSTANLDALLVFAGLYSAILTAFLIESYKNLQPDDKKDLLRQIAGQTANYSFSGGYLNSTYNPSQVKPFEVAISDIRVNVCWFASLILSLSTASFGILVRQWLREYITIDRTAPEERVRIWHYRSKGLEDWSLFEITALLPVLLQIAFALFFVGLCFFTAAVHSSIGTTSIVGVSGWAVLFIFSILAPAISPRCPYKTTFLKKAFAFIRPQVRSKIVPLVRFLVCIPTDLSRTIASVSRAVGIRLRIDRLHNLLRRLWAKTVSAARTAVRLLTPFGLSRLLATTIATVVQEQGENPPTSSVSGADSKPFPKSSDYVHIDVLKHVFRNALVEAPNVQEEVEIRSTDHHDLAIFASIDSLFFDDTLLFTVREDLKRRPRPIREVLPFVTTLVQSRVGALLPTADEPSQHKLPWPWALSQRARSTLVDILADSMFYELPPISNDHSFRLAALVEADESWSDALILILALISPQGSTTETVIIVLRQLLGDMFLEPASTFTHQMVAMSKQDSDWPAHCLSRIAFAWQALNPTKAAWSLGWIVSDSFVGWHDDYNDDDAYLQLLDCVENANPDLIAPTSRDIRVIFDIACVILHNFQVAYFTGESQIKEFTRDITQLLEFVFEAIPKLYKWFPHADFRSPHIPAAEGIKLDDVVMEFFINPHSTYPYLKFFSRHSQYLSPDNLLEPFLPNLVGHAFLIENTAVISILNACAAFFEEHTGTTGAMDAVDIIRLCYLIYMVPTDDGEEAIHCWHKLFYNAGACIDVMGNRRNKNCVGDGPRVVHTDLCSAASSILWRQDRGQNDQKYMYRRDMSPSSTVEEREKYLEWCKGFNVDKAQVPDEMVNTLRHFACTANTANKDGRTFWRVRRLEDLEMKNTTPSLNASTGSVYGNIGAAATVPIVEVSRGRRRAKSLFETFNSDFEFTPSESHMGQLTHHVRCVDSAAVVGARLCEAPPTMEEPATRSTSGMTGGIHDDRGHGQATSDAQTESSSSSHDLSMSPPHAQLDTGGAKPPVINNSTVRTELSQFAGSSGASEQSAPPVAAPRGREEALPATKPKRRDLARKVSRPWAWKEDKRKLA